MAGSSQKGKKKVGVSVQHECLLRLLPREVWSIIATMVASNSVKDLFNMQTACKVFLDVASSDAVYKHATMSHKPLLYYLTNVDGPKGRFLDRCVEVRNADAILWKGFMECFRFDRRDNGVELLARASAEGSLEAGYLCAMCLRCGYDDEDKVHRGDQMIEAIRASGQTERFTQFLTEIFATCQAIIRAFGASE